MRVNFSGRSKKDHAAPVLLGAKIGLDDAGVSVVGFGKSLPPRLQVSYGASFSALAKRSP